MAVTTPTGTVLSETALNALTAAPPAAEVVRVMTADVWQKFSYRDTNSRFEAGSRLLFRNGQVVPQAAIDALFVDATVTSVAPLTGPAAGGTDITITGTNFGGVIGVTVGGVACTLVQAVSETKITCRTAVHAAGLVNVVVTDDSGAATGGTGLYTYV